MRTIPLTKTAPWAATPADSSMTSDRMLERFRWSILAWIVIVAIGAVHAWAGRHEMNPDGMAYVDLARAFLRGDWSLAFNELWSPLYPALLAAILWVLKPDPFQEFAAVHALNFVLFLGALASFEFLLNQLTGSYRAGAAKAAADGRLVLPEWCLRALGYAVVAYSLLKLVSLSAVGPDMCVSVLVFLAFGLLLKIRQRPEDTRSFLLLGVVLGLGYLAKAPMLPMAFVFLALGAAAVYSHLPFRHLVRTLLAALIPFVLISGSLVLAFFLTGRGVSVGESGRLNYAWHVNGLPYVHWQGELPGSGRPAHPTRRLLSSPPVYEFASPIHGTYPPWDDPAYWHEGVNVHFGVRGQLRALMWNARVLASMLVRFQVILVIGAALLVYLGRRGRLFIQDARPYSILIAPILAAAAMFSVIWLEPRFLAPFVAPLWLGIFAPMTFPKSHHVERAIKGITLATLAAVMLVTSYASYGMTRDYLAREDVEQHFAVAQVLQRLGVHPGDKVAVISDWPGGSDAYWALLSQVRIIAEIPACLPFAGSFCPEGQPEGVPAFLRAGPGLREHILGVFEGAGAEAVVMRDGDHTALRGWRRVADTAYYVYLLSDGVQ